MAKLRLTHFLAEVRLAEFFPADFRLKKFSADFRLEIRLIVQVQAVLPMISRKYD